MSALETFISWGNDDMMAVKLDRKIIETLKLIHDVFQENEIRWVLAGSASLAIHGIDVRVEDIDVIADRDSALKIARLLSDFQIEELKYSSSETYRSYRVVFSVNGVRVDVLGDLQERIGNRWIDLTWRIDSAEKIEMYGRTFPLSPLADQLRSYAGSDREKDVEKAGKILEAMGKFIQRP